MVAFSFDLLALIQRTLKLATLLTLCGLVSTAFNWELGVSRQYLQCLEWIFQRGQQRIESLRSANRLGNGANIAWGPSADDCNGTGVRKSRSALDTSLNEDEDEETPRATTRKRAVRSVGPGGRRISTTDGPPVFLLDAEGGSGLAAGGKRAASIACQRHEFHLNDAALLVGRGLQAIVDDQVTKRFSTRELDSWNLLTRTDAKNYHVMSRFLSLAWFGGVLFRYAFLLPLRIVFTLVGTAYLVVAMALIGLLPTSLRARPYRLASLMSFRMLSCGITSRLEFHNRQWRAKSGDICVANHTSPIDVVLLACDNCYALVGQRHGGLLGLLENALSRATNHVWFDRGEMRDRQLVSERLREHLARKDNLPVLIFPEGTCINNSAVMLFRKGSFELTDTVCPVALKYDARFGDPFWNSSKQSYPQYLLLMMSSWAIKCDVWYLPPMRRLAGETSADFASRVKAEIARQGGLIDLNWDGQLKRSAAKEIWKCQQQEDYARRLRLE